MSYLKTTEYNKFTFREDNREKINQTHVKRLCESITSCNLLEMRPITVNEKFEVIDGQHRLLAAKALGLPIYYKVEKDLKGQDMILLNVSKSWGNTDFLNYYVKNMHTEYMKLNQFLKESTLSLTIALNVLLGRSRERNHDFRMGKFKFQSDLVQSDINLCWYTVEEIKRMNGHAAYLSTAKFWNALLKLIRDVHYDHDKWKINLPKMIERFGPRVSTQEYLKLFMEVHNHRNPVRVSLLDE